MPLFTLNQTPGAQPAKLELPESGRTTFVRMADGRVGVRLTPAAYVEGRVFLNWRFKAKVRLADMAGAPWSDKNPDATVRNHREQMRFLSRRERTKVLQGGSRLGKSVLGGIELLIAFLTPGTKGAVVASMYEQVDAEWRYFDKGLKKLFPENAGVFAHYVYRNTPNYHAFGAESIWGSSTVGYSTSEQEGAVLLGKEFTHIILGEGSRVSIEIFDSKISRALNSALMGYSRTRHELGFLCVYTTAWELNGISSHLWDRALEATNHNLRQLHYGRCPFAETMFFREADVLANPDYDRSAYEAARKLLSPEAFAEQFQGKRGLRSGRVYSEFNPTKHKVDSSRFDWNKVRDMRLFLGFDTGKHFAAILVGLDRDKVFWILGEATSDGVHIEESARRTQEMVQRTLGRAFKLETYKQLMPAIHGWKVDPASQQKIELRKAMLLDDTNGGPSLTLPTRFGGGKFDLVPTINMMKGLFSEDRIRVLDNCVRFLKELGLYRWEKRKKGEAATVSVKPIEADDHALDAGRFALIPLGLAGPLPREETAMPARTRLGLGFNPHHELDKWRNISQQRGPIAC